MSFRFFAVCVGSANMIDQSSDDAFFCFSSGVFFPLVTAGFFAAGLGFLRSLMALAAEVFVMGNGVWTPTLLLFLMQTQRYLWAFADLAAAVKFVVICVVFTNAKARQDTQPLFDGLAVLFLLLVARRQLMTPVT